MNCSKLKEKQCKSPCKWIRGKGCRKEKVCKNPKCPPWRYISPLGNKCMNMHLIGRGSYGCVVSPPIIDDAYVLKRYMPYTNRQYSDVGKIFYSDKDFKDELEFSKFIQKIDPTNKFTVKMKGCLKLSAKCTVYDESLQACLQRKVKNINEQNLSEIIFEYGGISLDRLDNHMISYADFLQMFKEFISGFITLQNNNIIHQDIKPANIVVDLQKKKFNIIDFGLMCRHYSELYDTKNTSSLKFLYPYYPPEFYVAYIMLYYKFVYENDKAMFDKFVSSILQRMELNGYFQQKHLLYDPYLMQEYQNGIKGFIETIKQSGATLYNDIFGKELAMKADVFSVASIIASLSLNIKFNSTDEEHFVDYIYQRCIRANPYERVTFVELYSIISSEQIRSMSSSALVYRKGGSVSSTISTFKHKLKAKILPFMALTARKLRHIFNKDHKSPNKGSHRETGSSQHNRSPRGYDMMLSPTHRLRSPGKQSPRKASTRSPNKQSPHKTSSRSSRSSRSVRSILFPRSYQADLHASPSSQQPLLRRRKH